MLDIMTENNMIMPHDMDKFKGTYTWSRGQNKSVIDFVLVNGLTFGICDQMKLDEQQEQFDLTDHNLIEISLKLNYMHPNYDYHHCVPYHIDVGCYLDNCNQTSLS